MSKPTHITFELRTWPCEIANGTSLLRLVKKQKYWEHLTRNNNTFYETDPNNGEPVEVEMKDGDQFIVLAEGTLMQQRGKQITCKDGFQAILIKTVEQLK